MQIWQKKVFCQREKICGMDIHIQGRSTKQKGWWNDEYNIFISMEPLLDNICTTLSKWIIIGAETGRRKDKVIPKREWVEEIVESCKRKASLSL